MADPVQPRPTAAASAPSMPARKPDVFAVYPKWLGKGGMGDHHLKVNRELGPVVGVARLHCYHLGTHLFVTPDPHELLKFPVDHDLAGQDRHEWVNRGDGIWYGYRKPEAAEDDHPFVRDDREARAGLTHPTGGVAGGAGTETPQAELAKLRRFVAAKVYEPHEVQHRIDQLESIVNPKPAQPAAPTAPAPSAPTATQGEKGSTAKP